MSEELHAGDRMPRNPRGGLPRRPRAGRHALLALLAFGLSLGIVGSAPAQVFDDAGFSTELVVTLPTFQPVGIAWSPDDTMFIWQRNGVVRIFHDGDLHSTPFVDISDRVNTYNDRGMLGLAIDPDFEQNGFVYLAYTYEPNGQPNNNGPKTARLSRVTANPSNPDVALPGSEVILIGGIPADGSTHTVGTLAFAPDGTLFFSNGDGAAPNFADPLAFGAQDLDSYRGKMLRINPDGSAPSPPQVTNPFYDGTDSIRSKVWAYGLRNPYRFEIHPTLGDVYSIDVGWRDWESVDRVSAGQNYGWPCYEGDDPQPEYQNLQPATCSALPPSAVTSPIYTYDHTMGSCVTSGAFATGTVYPQQYRDNFFFSDYSGEWIRRLELNPNGSIAQNVRFATNAGTVTSMRTGPDGLLYFTEFRSGEIRRVVYAGVSAVASATPDSGYSPLSVSFSSAGSSDGFGGALTYFWDFGDGNTSTLADPQHTYVSGGVQTLTATLTVSNGAGDMSIASLPITIGSLPPVPVIDTPLDGTGVEPGEIVAYSGSATDPDDGVLPGTALDWEILLRHNTHFHPLVESTGPTGNFTAEYHGEEVYSYELRLTTVDSSGLASTAVTNLPVLPDVTPPSTPQNLAAAPPASSAIDLSWDASTDNAAIFAYRVERCQGDGCSSFIEVATPSSNAYLDLGLQSETSYSYRVRAEDPAGNLSGYSNTVTEVTGSGPPQTSGLVAGWAFEEGSGAVAGDATGQGLDGAVSGATWTPAGRYGGALEFDGDDDEVVVPDDDLLDLGGAMTLSAWVYPTSGSGWGAVLQKEQDAYLLHQSSTNNRGAAAGATLGGSCCTMLFTGVNPPLDTWSHLAVTYDGAQMIYYIDGVAVDSRSASGLIEASTTPLRIGNNSYNNEGFEGRIDEVRIYDRALDAGEIQADIAQPIAPPAPDTTDPTVSLSAPPTGMVAGAVQLAATAADDVGVVGVQFLLDGAPLGAEDLVAPYELLWDTSLESNGPYLLSAQARDAAGNTGLATDVAITINNVPDTTDPTVSISSPAGGATLTGSLLVQANASDDVGVVGVQFLLDGAPLGAEDLTAPFELTWDTTQSADGAYLLSAQARDAAGNTAFASDVAVTVDNASDTTNPTVSLTSPAAGTLAGVVQLAANAADNIGVVGVQFLLDGAPLGAEDLAAPFELTWDTTQAADGPYLLSARARDAAGNTAVATSVAVTVDSTTGGPPGPVAAWAFEEGAGAVAGDATGQGHDGTVTGASWTPAGRYGGALEFDGNDDVVVVPDDDALDLGGAMTLSAWVYPTSGSGWGAVLQKEQDAYLLHSSSSKNRGAAAGATLDGDCCTMLFTGVNPPLNAWSHLAVTYDGAQMIYYVGGVVVDSRSASGLIEASTTPLRIGNNTYNNREGFEGRIDDVRVYDRALGASEIQADLAQPVAP